eukprot:1265461-Prymnesium_polylepis.1
MAAYGASLNTSDQIQKRRRAVPVPCRHSLALYRLSPSQTTQHARRLVAEQGSIERVENPRECMAPLDRRSTSSLSLPGATQSVPRQHGRRICRSSASTEKHPVEQRVAKRQHKARATIRLHGVRSSDPGGVRSPLYDQARQGEHLRMEVEDTHERRHQRANVDHCARAPLGGKHTLALPLRPNEEAVRREAQQVTDAILYGKRRGIA